jgi:hypothetical protein
MHQRTAAIQLPLLQISDAAYPASLHVLAVACPRSVAAWPFPRRQQVSAGARRRQDSSRELRRVAPTPLRGADGLDSACAPAVLAAMGERPVRDVGRASPKSRAGTPRADLTKEPFA